MAPPPRILELVPHEPRLDPRIAWVTALCAELAPTEVYATVWEETAPAREYDGRVYLERVPVGEHASVGMRAVATAFGALGATGPGRRYAERSVRPAGRNGRGRADALDRHLGAVVRFLAVSGYDRLIASALYRRARAVSIAPAVVVSHDLASLPAGVALKELFGARLVYDSHELAPEADLLAPAWRRRVVAALERRLVHRADGVVTVSPPLARELERLFGLAGVVAAPNAVPLEPVPAPASERATAYPVRFLLQGQLAAGRGIETLLEGWSGVDPERAVLWIRAPASAYRDDVERRFAGAIARGAVALLDPVPGDRLVEAAAAADVGVIPYPGVSAIHDYACPNKLSEYMHAGLAILSTDLEYVGGLLRRYDCGATYETGRPEAVAEAVSALVADLARVDRLKRNAYAAAREDFNWERQSVGYRDLLTRLLAEGRTAP
jgi:glycosyltransferase involved in cell wall biosynthesis